MPVEGLRPRYRSVRNSASVNWDDHVSHSDEAAHVLHRLLGDAVIELPFIPHDGSVITSRSSFLWLSMKARIMSTCSAEARKPW